MLGDFGTVKMRTKWSFSTSPKSRCATAGSLDDQGHFADIWPTLSSVEVVVTGDT